MRDSYLYLRIPNPKEGRKGLAIYRRPGGRVRDARIDAINKAVRDGTLTASQGLEQAKKVLADRRAQERPTTEAHLAVNVDVTERYWKARYANKRTSRAGSKETARYELNRLVKVLGSTDITSASQEALQGVIDRIKDPVSQVKPAMYLNAVLGFLGRPETVYAAERVKRTVNYLTQKEIRQLLQEVPDKEHRIMLMTIFATGCRLGEVFAIRRLGRKRSAWIESQMYTERQAKKEGRKYGPLKNSRRAPSRWAPVMGMGLLAVQAWIEVSEERRIALRELKWHDIIRDACKRAFKDRPDKHLTSHDLRHSYVIYWLDRGASTRAVARAIGDTVRMVEEVYDAFYQTDEAEEAMLRAERA